MAMRQAGLHLIHNPHKFYKIIEQELRDTGESYESYCYNVFHSKVWGDDLVAAVFSDMWNIAISVVSPCYRYPIDIWHGNDDPEILLIANGGSYMSEGKKTTHFSSTRHKDVTYKKPGRDLVNKTVGINPDLIYAKLQPQVLDDAEQARTMAIEKYMDSAKTKSLKLLYQLNSSIDKLDGHIAHLIYESEKKKEQRKKIEYKMQLLGISVEQIKLALQQKDLPYILTEEVEKEEIREDRKRKREEEEKEKQTKKQRREMIKVKDGQVISTSTKDDDDDDESQLSKHDTTLIDQQKGIMRSQEQVIQFQENQLIELNLRIKELESQNAQLVQQQQGQLQVQQQQQQQQQQDVTDVIDLDAEGLDLPTVPSFSNIPTLNENVFQQLDLTQQPGTSSGVVKGEFSVESLIKPEHWKHLPKYSGNVATKREVVEEEPVQETIEVVNLPPKGASNIIYIPKSVEQGSALVLMPQTQKRISNKRTNPGKPVPKEARDPKRYYCENCTCNYKEKSDLNKHTRFMCMQTEYGFICDTCMKGFHTDYGVREHFYQEHKKEHLYFCTRCNKGFYHKSHRSNHKKSCPNKDQPEIYPARAPIDEKLELTFKKTSTSSSRSC